MKKVTIPHPAEIEKYLKDKDNKGSQDGRKLAVKFRLSAKEIVDMFRDLEVERNLVKEKKHNKEMYDKFKNEHFTIISDKLVIRYLTRDGIKRSSITPKMIEIRRAQILDYRLRRKINSSKK